MVPVLLAVAASLAVVVLAAGGEGLGGNSGSSRRPSHLLLDYVLSVYLIVMAVGAVLLVGLLLSGKVRLRQAGLERRRRTGVLGVVVFAALVLAVAIALRAIEDGDLRLPAVGSLDDARSALGDEVRSGRYEPEFAGGAVIAVAALVFLAAAGLYAAHRARSRSRPAGLARGAGEALASVLDETLDDLRAERDPRRAVIGAYARLERTLAAFGLPRATTEAPLEYLARILAELAVSGRAARRLTSLFERAKFSQHEVEPAMKDDAIAALEQVRAELGAEEARAAAERLARPQAAS